MAVYRSDFAARRKDDASPVTEADERAEAFILAALRTLTPEIPIVAEEAVAAGASRRSAACSGWSTRSTAPRNSSTATTSSPSTSRSSRTASRCSASSTRRPSVACSPASPGGGAYVEDGAGRRADPLPRRAGRRADRRRQPLARRRRRAQRLSRLAQGGVDPRRRLVAEAVRWSPPAKPTCIRGSAGRWNGTSPPATPCCSAAGGSGHRPVRRAARLRQARLRQPALRRRRPHRVREVSAVEPPPTRSPSNYRNRAC